ncbi:glycosyltransferase [Candidatus Micrarchaeota archaeon]|nr:glycosyltransferase [Candidatus Micrarchaeota archaeon]
MRIGFFTETFLPQTNGVVSAVCAFGEDLVARGHEVLVFAPREKLGTTRRWTHNGMKVFSVPSVSFKPYPEYRVAIPLARVPQLDIVHTHGPFSMGLFGLHEAHKQHIPAVSTFHTIISEFVNYALPVGKRLLKQVAEKYCWLHYSRYDALITPTNAIREELPRRLQRRTFVVPNGVDLDFFHPHNKPAARNALGIRAKRVFLHLGRLSPEKNAGLLISAAGEFLNDGDLLVIVGKGPSMSMLQQAAKKTPCHGQIMFAGFAEQEKLPLYYSAADALVTASTAETNCLVAVESMACGTPVIAANCRALPEIVHDGRNGFLFEPGDARDLARVASKFRPGSRLSAGCLKTAKENSREKSVRKLEKVYEQLLAEKG